MDRCASWLGSPTKAECEQQDVDWTSKQVCPGEAALVFVPDYGGPVTAHPLRRLHSPLPPQPDRIPDQNGSVPANQVATPQTSH